MNKKCIGCGIIMQYDDNTKLGYIKEEKYDESLYCQRCYKMMHYNDNKIVDVPKSQNEIIDSVNKTNNFVFFLVDLFNLNKEIVSTYKKINRPKCLIISKMDLLPKSFKFSKIKEWIGNTYNINDEIIFLSSKKNVNISRIFKILDENNKKKCFFMGYTNAGKSTLLNKILDKSDYINTSLIPNTTLDFINIKVGEYTIIDSPGFISDNTIYAKEELDFVKKMSAKKIIDPINYQLKKNASIIIENKIRIANLEEQNSFTLYMSNLLDINRVFENNDYLCEYELKTYHIKKNTDVVINGLGFINIKKPTTINIYCKNHNLIELRSSFLGSEYYE